MRTRFGGRHHNPYTQSYGGNTYTSPNVTLSGCGTNDWTNVVGWRSLPSGVLGRACKWEGSYGALGSGDFALNSGSTWDPDILSDGCGASNAYDVQSVATHEFGHIFGLGHVSESSAGDLTMSPNINGPCQKAEADLGRGDADGINRR